MSAGGPDLFVICKNCGSEVSPYITECPYCGNRLRKRAPKLDRHGRIAERVSRRPPTPSLSRLRRGEIPGIRHESHAYATIVLVVLGLIGTLLWKVGQLDPGKWIVFGHFPAGALRGLTATQLQQYENYIGHWWRPFTASFFYSNAGYTVAALLAVAIYGTLMERRHGPIVVLALFLGAGVAGMEAAHHTSAFISMGGNAGALALLVAWSVPDLTRLLRKHEFEGDLIGTAVIGAVVALMHIADPTASWAAAGVGIVIGLLFGTLLARIHPV